jgi:hypothetical protein
MWLWGKYFGIRQDETGKAIFMVWLKLEMVQITLTNYHPRMIVFLGIRG